MDLVTKKQDIAPMGIVNISEQEIIIKKKIPKIKIIKEGIVEISDSYHREFYRQLKNFDYPISMFENGDAQYVGTKASDMMEVYYVIPFKNLNSLSDDFI